MTIRQKGARWESDVAYKWALPGYQRIRRTVDTEEEAKALHSEIIETLEVYGKWPVGPRDKPRELKPKPAGGVKTSTLREAAKIGLEFHWKDTPYYTPVSFQIWPMVQWFEEQGCPNLDDITSLHMDKFLTWRRSLGNTNNTINKYLSILGVLNTLGLKRKPRLCRTKLPIERLKVSRMEKWWLRPEKLEELVPWLNSRGDSLFADLVSLMCRQGFRIEEALRLRPRLFHGLRTEDAMVQVPGTKTNRSQRTIPVFPDALDIVERCILRTNENRWDKLFPLTTRQTRDKWAECREFLGVEDVKTATMKALRRTFAAYANAKGMPTKTLQDILGHETITTTEGYLDLVGSTRMEDARRFMAAPPETPRPIAEVPKPDFGVAIQAYVSTGASPESVAAFVKELMK